MDLYRIAGITIAAVTILFEVWTLKKTLKCDEHKDIIKIMVVLISSSAMLLIFFCFANEDPLQEFPLMLSLALGLGFSFFNVAHWMFVYEYYNLVRILPYIYENKSVP